MNRNPLQTIFSKKFWLVCIAVGIFLLGIVFALSRQADMQNCEQRLAGAIEFIKEQAADYTKYNETAIAKGLVREAAAVHALESLSLDCDEAALSERAKGLWLTGICLLDAQGELVCEYTEDGIGYAQLQSGIKLEPILSVIGYPQKTYVKHVELDDGSFADVAVHSCADGAGAVLAYRYTGAEFSQKSVLSIQPLIDSYGVNSTGTLLVVEENRVSASNDPTLIGMNIFESERLMSIRRSNRADKLIRVYAPKGIEQCYGMYSHGRNYSLYAYVPARQVYDLTVMNLVITLVMYILVLTFVQGFRWNSAKDFFMQQENSEQEYKKSLEQKNAALELAVQRETKANLAKREFLFNMSHDIRTPMNAIIGFTALAQTHIDDRDQVEDYLKKISVSSQHLLSLINDVLDMSRIENGKVTLETKPVHLPELVGDIGDAIQVGADKKHISFTVDTAGMKNEDVIADPLRLEQILINVLANAVKFTPDGGQISLRIVQKDTASADYADFEFHIKDNGIGMSEEFQQVMFNPFTRADDKRTTQVPGTGLGMAIAQNIVKMMNGEIKVESKLNQGTRIMVTIYLKLQDKEYEKIKELAGLPVLVVDDDELCCENTVATLQGIGLKGEWVNSGEKAVQLAYARHDKKDDFFAIIMDWQMPGMDGIETTRKIRERIGSDVTIIMLTSYDYADIVDEAKDAGVDGFIEKPLFRSKLTSTLQRFIEHKEAETPRDYLAELKATDYSQKRVLMVEDNQLNREIACSIIGMTKVQIETAENGKEAVDKIIQSPEGWFDLVFMDIQMPIMNGYEATAAIRALAGSRGKVPIVAVTANAFAEDVQLAKNAGMNGHLEKPLDFKKLSKTLTEWLG